MDLILFSELKVHIYIFYCYAYYVYNELTTKRPNFIIFVLIL